MYSTSSWQWEGDLYRGTALPNPPWRWRAKNRIPIPSLVPSSTLLYNQLLTYALKIYNAGTWQICPSTDMPVAVCAVCTEQYSRHCGILVGWSAFIDSNARRGAWKKRRRLHRLPGCPAEMARPPPVQAGPVTKRRVPSLPPARARGGGS
jgi:hypothetical protein